MNRGGQGNYLVLSIISGACMTLSTHLPPKLCSLTASSPCTQLLPALSLQKERLNHSPLLTQHYMVPCESAATTIQKKTKATVRPVLHLPFGFTQNLAYNREAVCLDYRAFKQIFDPVPEEMRTQRNPVPSPKAKPKTLQLYLSE